MPTTYIGGVNMLVAKVGEYCREFRMQKLRLRLQDVEGGEQVKTLSAFEHGRSANIYHLFKYVRSCKDRQQKLEFFEGLIDELEGEIDGQYR